MRKPINRDGTVQNAFAARSRCSRSRTRWPRRNRWFVLPAAAAARRIPVAPSWRGARCAGAPGQARLLASSIGHPVVIWTRFGTGFTLDGTHWIRTSQGELPLDHGGDGARRCQFPARRLAAPERTGQTRGRAVLGRGQPPASGFLQISGVRRRTLTKSEKPPAQSSGPGLTRAVAPEFLVERRKSHANDGMRGADRVSGAIWHLKVELEMAEGRYGV